MEDNKLLKEKEQLIEGAIEKVIQGGDTNYKLAIWDLQKSYDIPFRYPNSPSGEETYANAKANTIRYLIETLMGFNKSKQNLICHLLEGGDIRISENSEKIWVDGVQNVVLRSFANDFLFDQLPEMWLKSLKYDALLKALEDSEFDDLKDKEKLAKLLSIIGK